MRRHNYSAALCLLAVLVACGGTDQPATDVTLKTAQGNLLGERTILAGLRIDTLSTSAELLQAHLDRVIEEESQILQDQVAVEAFDAVAETQNALRQLDANDRESALAALERAVGKLDILLARRPELGLVPLDFRARVVDMQADAETAEMLVERAKTLVDDGYVQEAKRLLGQLTSEITVTTVNLPLATYPDAIRGSVRLLEAADSAAARRALQVALTTLVIQDRIIPLPLVNASAMIEQAEQHVEQGDTESAGATLADAREQIRLANVLGYGDSQGALKQVERDLARLTKEVAAGEDTESLFRTLKGRIGQYQTNSPARQPREIT